MKKMILRSLIIVLGLVVGIGVFAGGQQEPVAEEKGGTTTVVFYLWDDPAYKSIMEEFNNSQSEVFVDAKFIATNEYEAKISTLLAGGAQMDGYMQKRSTDIFAHNSNGYLAPLDQLSKDNNFDLSAISGYKNAITIGGQTLAIPFRGASFFTYYNKKNL